ncbi:MAG TPA: chemotaxis protein MotC, partial [Hyphomicrobiaceae bacterium]|nr:chemotaxis protein MotC [Hyphomicrobiaceae bacterium]
MTHTLARLLIGLGLVLAMPMRAEAQSENQQLYELVRSLQGLQDQSAHGNATAHISQRALLAQIAAYLDRIQPGAWQDARNARAALIYVLSGGDPQPVARLLAKGPIPGIDDKLVRGVVAYAQGRNGEAQALLGPLDALTIDPSIAGQIALVQGELAAKTDAAKAMMFLDQARLLAPGTLVEDAALRRQISLIGASGDFDRFEAMSTRYLRRFPNSIYAGSFRRQFATEIAGHPQYADDPARLAKLKESLAGVEVADRRDIYLTIAREGIHRGKVAMTRFAAGNAVQLSGGSNVERARAEVYQGAALVVSEDFEQGLTILKSVDRQYLTDQDKDLLNAAISVAEDVRRPPADPSGPPPEKKELLKDFKSVALARMAMARVDKLLSEAD